MASKIMREIKRPFKQLGQLLGIIKKPKAMMTDKEIESDRAKFISLHKDTRFSVERKYDYICKDDKYVQNGGMDNQYFIQDIWGARKVYENKPEVHYDVGSSVAGFIAHLQGFKQQVCLIDIRPMRNLDTPFLRSGGGGGKYTQANATNLTNIADESLESLSALCSIEHFGLGRYGDPIEPDAWEKALKSFQRVLKSGGKLYISVPVGKIDKVCFNAHRVYRPQTIIDTLNECQIIEMSYIDGFDTALCMEYRDDKLQIYQDKLDSIPDAVNWGTTGLFEFVKK
ncbi:DUF268 domain-containing protein [Helicobacter didelphidarum]|nr:DUF268 domain-containing protein [Helicobacter didelphidarum]